MTRDAYVSQPGTFETDAKRQIPVLMLTRHDEGDKP